MPKEDRVSARGAHRCAGCGAPLGDEFYVLPGLSQSPPLPCDLDGCSRACLEDAHARLEMGIAAARATYLGSSPSVRARQG
jgi:hypothetical protein